jgi:L-amino acid N-acyltransferase YncA
MPLLVRPATGADAAACVEIYRPYVLDTVITFETRPPTVEDMAARIVAARVMHEWLVLEVDGDVAGYAYAQQFNSRAAYQWSVETSVYMAHDRLRIGGGRMLYAELLSRLTRRGFRRAFAGIAQPNEASNALHETFGFRPVGRYQRVDGSTVRGTTSSGGSSTWLPPTTRSTRQPRSLLELGRRQAQQSARDHQLLDLLGALEDVQDLGVTPPLLQQ